MQKTLDAILRRFVCVGQLTVRWPNGQRSTYAGPPDSGPAAGIVIGDARTIRRLVLNPTLAVGEAYMDGGLVPDGCGIYDVIEVLALNVMANAEGHPIARLRSTLGVIRRRIDQYNPAYRARRNVAHHYDLNGRLYSLFLDRDRQYSCAYFPTGNETLEEAQVAKKRHIAAKLCLDRPDLTVLDIGCGWGGLALTLAREHGARVTGITLSTEQLAEARARAAAEGLTDRVSFELVDYRAMDRTFDRIVSVGMFEHVGVVHYREFFDTIARCLKPDGVALLHAIGRSDGPGFTNPWIAKYIFPGGYCPALSEVVPAVERAAWSPPISRSCGCTTRRRCATGGGASSPTATPSRRSTTNASAGCSSSISAGRRSRSAASGHMVFQIQLGAPADRGAADARIHHRD